MFFAILSIAQTKTENKFFHDISVDYGIFASLNSDQHENLAGNKLNLQTSYFFINDLGIRSGITFVSNMEGCNKFYSVPVQLVYRTPVYKSHEIYIHAENLTDFIFKLIVSLMPKQYEFNIGTNLGYIEPNNQISIVSINDGPSFEKGYGVEQRFVSTIDVGFKGKYKIRRFGITLSPTVNYLLTKNFKYNSELFPDKGYTPQFFLSFTFGLAYEF